MKEKTMLKPGNIVKIRNRLWRIDTIYGKELEATTVDSYNNFQKKFYYPIEKIEHAEVKIPDYTRLGDLASQKLLIDAYRISLIHGSSPLLSLQRSSVIPMDFQLVPVIMSLNSGKTRLLIADDVGLGKTIEAGLIVNELIARNKARKILIVCPAPLREQWQDAMASFFKIDFRIISSMHRKYLERDLPVGISPWEYFPKLITSVDYAKGHAMSLEVLSCEWDMVIIDEAHICARPHSNQDRESIMQRWEFMSKLAKRTTNLLLLTATPHNGYTDTFASLIEILNEKCVKYTGNAVKIDKQLTKKYVCQRRRKDVVEWIVKEGKGKNPFPEANKREVHVEKMNAVEMTAYDMLKDYGKKIIEFTGGNNYIAQFTALHFLKRTLSSPGALRKSILNRIQKIADSSEEDVEINKTVAQAAILDSDIDDSMNDEEANTRIERSLFSVEVSGKEKAILDKVYEYAKKISIEKDSKFQKLINEVIPEMFRAPGKKKMIVFTRYKDTMDYLVKYIQEHMGKDKIGVFGIHGQMKNEQRKEQFKEFDRRETAIIVATDCISEGMNLQYLCSKIVHYELPWNPNRLEQRNGRVDRFGQPEKEVFIRTFIVDETLDEDILEVIVKKADAIKAEFGFSPPFFNDEKEIWKQLVKSKRNPKNVKDKNTSGYLFGETDDDADESLVFVNEDDMVAGARKIQEESFYGQADISLPDIENKIRESNELAGSESEVEEFIKSGLKRFGCRIEEIKSNEHRVVLDDKLRTQGMDSIIEHCTFNKETAMLHPDNVLLDLSHPIVDRLIQLIKQQSFTAKTQYGATACKISSTISKPVCIFKVLARFTVATLPPSIIEEVLTYGITVFDKKDLDNNQIKEFENSRPETAKSLSEKEFVNEYMDEVFKGGKWMFNERVMKLCEHRTKELIKERQQFILEISDEDRDKKWIKGMDDIKFASYDIISITLGVPK